ncbi:hypothetical protein Tco_0300970 [Tanacetum coccineum]
MGSRVVTAKHPLHLMQLVMMRKWRIHFPWHVTLTWKVVPSYRKAMRLVPSCFAIFTFEPLTLSLTSMPSCDLESLTNILILCLILKASDQSLRKSLSLNLELS